MPERFSCRADRADRLDRIAAELTGLTRSRISILIAEGAAELDGEVCRKSGAPVKEGMNVAVTVPDAAPAKAVPQQIDLDVLYQDDDVAVVLKPSGMVAHPAAGNPDGTLVNALLARLDRLSGIGGELRPGIVHRIDKDTSGLLLVAKNDRAHLCLSEQIAAHTVHRAYLAMTAGHMKEPAGRVDRPVGRHPKDRKKMAVVPDGKEAQTDWRVLEELRGADLLECVLSTGRTHQIRVHMSSLGHPVLGDPVYVPKGTRPEVPGGQLLHAYRIGFTHPVTGEEYCFTVPPEKRMLEWYLKLGGQNAEDRFPPRAGWKGKERIL